MSKLINMMVAGALAITMGGWVFAADSDQSSGETQSQQPAVQDPIVNDPAAGGATASQSYQEYLVELKNCEPLTGDERQKCIDSARRKHGEM